jgi:hypothetical protein
MDWIDGFFARIYGWNHRYFVEFTALIICAIVLHVGYGVLTDRQTELARQRSLHEPQPVPPPSIDIGTINNSGSGSSTTINQNEAVPSEGRKR